MANIEKEIADRLNSSEWDKLIAEKVLSSRAKRKSDIKNLLLSLIAFCLITMSYFFASKIEEKSSAQMLFSSKVSIVMEY